MKNKILLAFGLALVAGKASSQFFFQDIHNTRQTIANMALLKENKVKTQIVQSMDATMETDNDFRCERQLSPTYHQLRTQTQSRATGYSVTTSTFSAKGLLTKTTDSTNASVTVTIYRYDNDGRLQFVSSTSMARNNQLRYDETRSYTYDNAGHLQKMVQKKSDNMDTLLVNFKVDSAGNVIEEQEIRKNLPGKRIFYNYDTQGHLTDIFRYQPVKKRMLPDYIFEYDNDQRLSKMTTVNTERASYNIWKYTYQANGLPLKEECYGKGNELMGIVKYQYILNP